MNSSANDFKQTHTDNFFSRKYNCAELADFESSSLTRVCARIKEYCFHFLLGMERYLPWFGIDTRMRIYSEVTENVTPASEIKMSPPLVNKIVDNKDIEVFFSLLL